MRLDVAGVEHERVVQLVALAHALDLLGAGGAVEPLVDGVVDDVDLVGRDAEVAQDVALRGLRHRQHARGPVRARHHMNVARVGVGQPVRQVLREQQVDAVVDRHDRPAGRQRRQHVVRRVEEVDPLARGAERDARSARAPSRCRRVSTHGRKFRPEVARELAVLGAAEQDVLVDRVEPRQVAQQVAHVRADAVVVQLAGVDR